jgi:hypothetical protein
MVVENDTVIVAHVSSNSGARTGIDCGNFRLERLNAGDTDGLGHRREKRWSEPLAATAGLPKRASGHEFLCVFA